MLCAHIPFHEHFADGTLQNQVHVLEFSIIPEQFSPFELRN